MLPNVKDLLNAHTGPDKIAVAFLEAKELNPDAPHVVVCTETGYKVYLIELTNESRDEEVTSCTIEVVKAISSALKLRFPDETFKARPPKGTKLEDWKPQVQLRSFFGALKLEQTSRLNVVVSEQRDESTCYLHTLTGVMGKDEKLKPVESDIERYHEQWFNYINKLTSKK